MNPIHDISYSADVNQAQVIIDSGYYGCITKVTTMIQAFVHPSKVMKSKLLFLSELCTVIHF